MALRQLEELLRVEHRRALHPGVERVRCYRVEFLGRRLDEMPRIVDADVDLRVADDVEVVLGEIGRDDARHQRLDFGDRLVLDRRIDRDGAGRHAGATADDEHLLRLPRQQRRHVAEHPLEPHVLRLARGLHLARVVIVPHAVRQLRYGDGRVQSFADINDVRLAHPRRRVSAVRDEQTRQLVHASREQTRRHHRERQHDGPGEIPGRRRSNRG